jgi:CheY-like chemotaxis protein
MHGKPYILLAEDDKNDAFLTQNSVARVTDSIEVTVVPDGAELLSYLRRSDNYAQRRERDPLFVLLDIKMPKLNGLDALHQIKADPNLRKTVVVMFTSSNEQQDIVCAYDEGANGYVIKPLQFKQFGDAIRKLLEYWLNTNQFPSGNHGTHLSGA